MIQLCPVRFVHVAVLVTTFASGVTSFAEVKITRSDRSTSVQTRYQFAVEGVESREVELEGKRFTSLKLKGVENYSATLHQEGMPEIPVIRFFVEGEVKIKVGGVEQPKSLVTSNAAVKPVQASRPKIAGYRPEFKINLNGYARNEFYPAQAYTVESAGSVNGVSRSLVTLHPVSYNPAKGGFLYRREFTVIERVAKAAFNKSIDVAPTELFVLVVGDQFRNSPSLAQYRNFKSQLGYRVETLVAGQDFRTPSDLRAKLQTLHKLDGIVVKGALIVGDARDVPGYSSRNIAGITDHYYRAIDTDNYETDFNGPDIGVGRFPTANERDLAAMVEKSIKYQRGVFADESWLNGLAWLATDDQHEIAEGSHNYVIQKYAAPAEYLGIFPKISQVGGDQLYAVTHRVPGSKVQEAMRSGRTLIQYSGHGLTDMWDAPRVTQADVRRIADPNALPFVVSNACITADFREDESFAETWMRHPTGAIAFWGSMDSSYWDEDDVLERAQHDHVYRDGGLGFSEMTHYALAEVWRRYGGAGRSKYYWETYTFFGDPSIEFRTMATRPVALEGPSTVSSGAGSVEYRLVDSHGRNVDRARVALVSADHQFQQVRMTDAQGMVSFSLPRGVVASGDFTVTAKGPNLRLAQKVLRVSSVGAPK